MITCLILKEWLLCNYCCLYFVVVVDVVDMVTVQKHFIGRTKALAQQT